jgi:hypothetical protein
MMLEGVQVGYPPFLVLAVCLTCHFDLEDRLAVSGCNRKKLSAAHVQRILPFILIDHTPDFVSDKHRGISRVGRRV